MTNLLLLLYTLFFNKQNFGHKVGSAGIWWLLVKIKKYIYLQDPVVISTFNLHNRPGITKVIFGFPVYCFFYISFQTSQYLASKKNSQQVLPFMGCIPFKIKTCLQATDLQIIFIFKV